MRSPRPVPPGASVAVIGGGVAGAATVAALRRAGLAPLLVDRHATLGAEGSGNPCGLLKPRLTADGGLHGRFYGHAYLHACATLDTLASTTPRVWVERGLLAVARDAGERATMERLYRTLPRGEVEPVDSAEAWRLAGVRAPLGGLWYPRGGAIRPAEVCRALAGDVPRRRAEVARLERTDGVWRLIDGSGDPVAEAAAVVLCAGAATPTLAPEADLPLHANRGQITLMPARRDVRHAVTFGGYVTPSVEVDGRPVQVVGATYARLGPAGALPDVSGWQTAEDSDDRTNLDRLAAHLPEVTAGWDGVAPVGARVALRAMVADYMPVMGPLFIAADMRAAYADLHHGRRPETYPQAPWSPGLFVLGGLGSRGFQAAPLLAEALAAMMTGAPPVLADDLLAAVHPARFVLRALRKGPRGSGRQRGVGA